MSPGVLARLCFDTHKYSFHGCNLPMGELMQTGHFASKHNSQVLGRIDVTAMKWDGTSVFSGPFLVVNDDSTHRQN